MQQRLNGVVCRVQRVGAGVDLKWLVGLSGQVIGQIDFGATGLCGALRMEQIRDSALFIS